MSSPEKPKRPVILIVSLILNALMLGVLIGGGIAKGGDRGQAGPPKLGEFDIVRGIDQAVDPADRRVVRATFRQAFFATRPQRNAVHEAHRGLRQALLSEPYDSAAVRAAFRTLAEAESALKSSMHEVLATEMSRLTPEQRAALLAPQERFRRRPRSGKPRFQRDRD